MFPINPKTGDRVTVAGTLYEFKHVFTQYGQHINLFADVWVSPLCNDWVRVWQHDRRVEWLSS